ncbi:DUF4160 domain-containing protein [Frisingicoccus sp.]|uniref:DUF4160 domain-containing protein n=1 Tax=Frisingicoccus sp. TaxID=1918627 RepID=UPI003AB883A4
MPKYYEYKIEGYYLYFTSFCTIECMHVHASDRKLTEAGSAKFFVKENGDSVLQNRGLLNDREIRKIQIFIKNNYLEMYLKWSKYSQKGFLRKIEVYQEDGLKKMQGVLLNVRTEKFFIDNTF